MTTRDKASSSSSSSSSDFGAGRADADLGGRLRQLQQEFEQAGRLDQSRFEDDPYNLWLERLKTYRCCAEKLAALLAESRPPQPQGLACIACGELDQGGYEVEDGPGPFCRDCWEQLEACFKSAGDSQRPPDPPTHKEPTK